MSPLDTRLNYEPPQGILKLWTSTYTSTTNYNGVTLPGLFRTNLFAFHALCFAIILFGEFYGWYKIRDLSTSAINQVFLGLIGVDFVLVLTAYYFVGKLKVVASKLVLENNANSRLALERSTYFPRAMLLLIKLLLLGIAVFKIYSYMDLTRTHFDSMFRHADVIPVIVLYAVVAVLHMIATTSFIAYLVLYIRIKIDQHDNISTHRTRLMPAGCQFEDTRVPAGLSAHYLTRKMVSADNPSTLVEDEDPGTQELYKLHTWGLLADEHLDALIWAQRNPKLKRELALIGLSHQLDILGEGLFQPDNDETK